MKPESIYASASALPDINYLPPLHHTIAATTHSRVHTTTTAATTKLCSRGHWRPSEDSNLKDLVSHYGPQNWNLIAHHLPGRSGKSCRLRWLNQLDPRINRKAFTDHDEDRLLAAHRLYGNKWAIIARLFPGRTDNAVKNHWHVIMARNHREKQHYSTHPQTRQKPASSSSSLSPPQFQTNTCSASVESTITTTIHQSDSALQHHQALGFLFGSSKENIIKLRDGSTAYVYGAKERELMGVGNSDSNSEVSATESVSNNQKNVGIFEGIENDTIKNNTFIDFLGVGAS